MTAEGASSQAGYWAARPWLAVRRLSSRTSLRVKLIMALVTLVLIALAAMGFAGVSLLRSDLIAPYNAELQNAGTSQAVPDCVANYLSGNGGNCRVLGLDIYWLTSSGQLETVSTPQSTAASNGYMPQSGHSSLPDLSGVSKWLADNTGQAITVPAQSGGDRWQVMSFYATATSFSNDSQTAGTGTIILAADVTGVYSTIQQLIGVDLIVSVVILFVLLIAGFWVVQANLRPLVDIEETAGEIAAGHLNRRVPERDPRTEIGSLGRSLNTMLSQIETAFHAREKSEAAAHQSEERMRRFIADASHELRTPLTAIRGFAEYYRQRGGLVPHWDKDQAGIGAGALAGGLTPNDLDRIMQRVEKEAARMGLLVEDLLLLARLDQQRPLAQQPIDLLSLAADAVHDARMLAPDRTINLSVQPGAAFLIIGDEPRLRQVIGNLMSNALTHTPDGTPIEVSISSGTLDPRVNDPTPAVILDVTDHGPGMTAEQAHRVFERFYRADQARTRTAGGSGLGLAIVSALVAAHGGVASVRTGPDRGATFRVTLPLAPEAQGGLPADDDSDLDQFGPMDDPDFADETDEVSVTYGTSVGSETGDPDRDVDASRTSVPALPGIGVGEDREA
jgi:two-component system OmpR family sensor kinase